MNIFNKVTLQSLKRNKVRTLVTIIGIMLSTSLICAVTTSIASVRQYAINYIEYIEGSWHGHEPGADYSLYETLKGSDQIKETGALSYIGYADIESRNEFKPYLYISGIEEDKEGLIPVHIISGRMPADSSEILIPEHLEENGGVSYGIGDTLKLEIGDRRIDQEKCSALGLNKREWGESKQDETFEDPILTQDDELLAAEESGGVVKTAEYLDIREEREYTVVGIYKRIRYEYEAYSAPGYTAFTVPESYSGDTELSVFFTMKDINGIYDFYKENELKGEIHRDLLMFNGIARYRSFYNVLFGLGAIVIGLIVFGSVMLIYNAFAISVSERTKQFGLLSSIGATKKQLRRMVRFEAVTLSAIGIPLGIGLGILGMWVTFISIGSRFQKFSENDYPEPLRVCVSKAAIIAACVIAFVTIIISVFIPSVRATRISAVEAIRQSTDIKQKKSVKTPKIIYKLFGISGLLSHKYFKRSKKKYRTTIISLFMSIVLFISAYSFTSYLVIAVEDTFFTAEMDYYAEIDNTGGDCDPDRILELMKNTEHITDVEYFNYQYMYCDADEGIINKDFKDFINSEYSGEMFNGDSMTLGVNIYYLEDGAFRRLLRKNGLSEEKYMNTDKLAAVAVGDTMMFDRDAGRTIHIRMLASGDFDISAYSYDEIDGYYFVHDSEAESKGMAVYYKEQDMYSYEEDDYDPEKESIRVPVEECRHEMDIFVGDIIDEYPLCLETTDLSFIMPISRCSEGTYGYDRTNSYRFAVKSDDSELGYEALQETLKSNDIKNVVSMYNYAVEADSNRSLIVIIKVFAYGFIVLISLIAAANVFNTITTNINLRRRDFAMLKSVGMTDKCMRKMLNYECLMYGTKALIYGLPAAAAVTYLIYRTIMQGVDVRYIIPWKAVGISVLSVFAVVFSTMMYSMRKVKKDNPVETLKNENL